MPLLDYAVRATRPEMGLLSRAGDFLAERQDFANERLRQLRQSEWRPWEWDYDTRAAEMRGLLAGGAAGGPAPDWTSAIGDALGEGITPWGLLGHTVGKKRFLPFFHGTKTSSAKQGILEKGFMLGESSGKHIKGTSISEDPLVSLETFANRNPDLVLGVDVTVDPANVRNLRPSEYLGGLIPEHDVWRKPNIKYREAETFGRRTEKPADWIVDLGKRAAQERNKNHQIVQDWMLSSNRPGPVGWNWNALDGAPEEVLNASRKARRAADLEEWIDNITLGRWDNLEEAAQGAREADLVSAGVEYGILSPKRADEITYGSVFPGDTLRTIEPPPFKPRELKPQERAFMEQSRAAVKDLHQSWDAMKYLVEKGAFARLGAGGLGESPVPHSKDYYRHTIGRVFNAQLSALDALKGNRGVWGESADWIIRKLSDNARTPERVLLRDYETISPNEATRRSINALREKAAEAAKIKDTLGRKNLSGESLDNAARRYSKLREEVVEAMRDVFSTPVSLP